MIFDDVFISKLIEHALGMAADEDEVLLADVQEWLVDNGILEYVFQSRPCREDCLCQKQSEYVHGMPYNLKCFRRRIHPEKVLIEPRRMKGTIKFYSEQREYGFVLPEGGGKDVFLHKRSIGSLTAEQLRDGSPVSFTVEECSHGLRVVSILYDDIRKEDV
jgi:cold shock protein